MKNEILLPYRRRTLGRTPICPQVSVLMPVYNREAYVAESIQSVLDQSFYSFELLVQDDGSTDRTLDIVRSFNDPRLYVYSWPENRGIAAALNALFLHARGRYCTVMDSDDVMTPDSLQWRIEAFQRNVHLGIVFGHIRYFIGVWGEILKNTHLETWFMSYYKRFGQLGCIEPAELRKACCIISPLPSSLFLRSLGQQFGPFRGDLRYAFDWEWLLRLSGSVELTYQNRTTHDYRIHPGNNSQAWNSGELPLPLQQENRWVLEHYEKP